MPFDETAITLEEYLAFLISLEVRDGEITGVGTLSPVPLLGAVIAKKTHAPRGKILVLGDNDSALVDGSKELFDLAQRGKLGLFFLSGAQIDKRGNINLTCIGDYDSPKVRLPGGAGSAMLYYMAKRTVLFAMSHSPRVFVESVDFTTSIGDDDYPWRLGRLTKVVTPLCVFSYSPEKKALEVESIHPGVTPEEVSSSTGFEVAIPSDVTSPIPDGEVISLIRNEAIVECEKIYPLFFEKLRNKIESG